MVVDPDGRFVTQREVPALALARVEVAAGTLRLAAPGRDPIAIARAAPGRAIRDVVVWDSRVRGADAGDAAAAWLSAHLARPVRLVRFDPSLPRRCYPEYAGDSGAHTLFADGYPVLVIGAASLAELNARLEARGARPMPMNRFRPNVVLEGLDAHAEDHAGTIAIGDVVLRPVKPCVRCQVTVTNQDTGDVGIEPLRTLAAYRMDERYGGVTFGMNAIVEREGALAVGAAAKVELRF